MRAAQPVAALALAACALVHVKCFTTCRHASHASTSHGTIAPSGTVPKSDTTGTYCSRLLANGAQRGPLPMPLRLSQSNRHSNGKQRYRESPQHGSSSLKLLKLYASRRDLR